MLLRGKMYFLPVARPQRFRPEHGPGEGVRFLMNVAFQLHEIQNSFLIIHRKGECLAPVCPQLHPGYTDAGNCTADSPVPRPFPARIAFRACLRTDAIR